MYFVTQLLSSDSTIVTHDDVDTGLFLSLCIIFDHVKIVVVSKKELVVLIYWFVCVCVSAAMSDWPK